MQRMNFELSSFNSIDGLVQYSRRAGFRDKGRFIRFFSLILSDALSFFVAIVLWYFFSGKIQLIFSLPVDFSLDISVFSISFVLLSLVWIVNEAAIQQRYQRRRPFWAELQHKLNWTTWLGIFHFSLLFSLGFTPDLGLFLMLWFSAFALLPLFRFFTRLVLHKFNLWETPTFIFGVGDNAVSAYHALVSESDMGYKVVCFINPAINDAPNPVDPAIHEIGLPVVDWLGSDADADVLRVGHSVLALNALDRALRDNIIRLLTSKGIFDIHVIPAMRGIPLYGMSNSHFFSHDVLMIHVQNNLSRPVLKLLKRCFDVLICLVLLILLLPLFAFVAIRVKADGGSVFYGHKRMGQNGKWFHCLKFRSMAHNSEELLRDLLANDAAARAEWERDFKLKNDPRVTNFGRFIRSTSIDELPQLINVIKGEMSLVGPRPIVDAELRRYGEDAYYYLLAKPGITGLWQVSGRSDVDYETRVYFDAWYVKNWSLWTDIAILFKTVKVVFGKTGAY